MKKLLYILLFVPIALFGQDNYSLSFDGVDDYVDIQNNSGFDLTESFTMIFFTRINQSDIENTFAFIGDDAVGSQNQVLHFHCIVNYEDVGYGGCTSDFCVGLDFYEPLPNHGLYSSFEVNNEWTSWVATYNSETSIRRIYANGELIADSTMTDNYYQGNSDLLLGANYSTFSSLFKGKMDNFILMNTDNSDEQIHGILESINTCSPIINDNELVCYFNFNDISSDTVYDISGNGNHGIINGFATYSNDVPEVSCLGCKNPNAINYDENAVEEDEESCIYSQDYVHGLWNEVDDGAIEFSDYQEQATTSLSSLQQALDTWNTLIDLSGGWNMFGYGCPSSISVADGLSNNTESIIITKDNNGNVYMPEFGFNGIGDFTPGFGYQIKLTEAIEDFSLCDWYVNDIPEDNIVSLQDSINILNSEILDLECVNQGACSFNIDINECEFALEGFNCSGEFVIAVGDTAFGGIVFYIDETGQNGLVASIVDLEYEYSWGCYGIDVPGAYGTIVGTGFQNTLDIINAECYVGSGETIPAAEAAYSHVSGVYNDWYLPSYDDWYLPSINELELMYYNIGVGSSIGNVGNLTGWYWSSTEMSVAAAFNQTFNDNIDATLNTIKSAEYKVRPIRSF
tara:strand:- start:4641 stop:6521 length:1881 start_codon:yes stop_codon:yes gene_type:complete